jgi:flagellin-like hook-associated protein FlgL
VTLNTPGDQVFGNGGAVDLFQELSALETALRNHDPAAVRATESGLDAAQEQISAARATNGFRAQQIDTASAVLAQLKLNLTSLASQAEDADMAEALVRLSYQELVLQSVMESSSKLLQTNLLNFLE